MLEQTYVAADAGHSFGYIVGLLLVPAIGLLLLVLGLRRRSAGKRQQAERGYAYPPGPPPAGGSWNPGPPPGSGGPVWPQAPQGYPPSYPPGGYPPAGYPPPVPNRPGGTALIVVGSIVLVLGLVGAAGATVAKVGRSSGPDGLAVGECITDDQYAAKNVAAKPVDCSQPDAVYQLARRGGATASCPDGKRLDSGYGVLFNKSVTYCFVLNAREGACYRVDVQENVFTPADCVDPQATTKIAKRADGTSDPSECGPDVKAVVFPDPPRVYCIVPAQP